MPDKAPLKMVPPARHGPSLSAIAPQPSGTSASSRRPRTTILVSRPVYLLCWWFVCVLHLIVGMFVLFTGFSHLVLSIPAVHVATLALQITIPLKRLSGVSYVIVAIFHFRSIIRMVNRSVRARRLVLGCQEAAASQRVPPSPKRTPRRPTIVRRVVRIWQKFYGPDGFLSITGAYFAGSMAFRECLEVVLQSYQAVALSRAVSRAWINHFAVASVVVNCWSSTIVRVTFAHRSVAVSRLLHVVVDMYLDCVFGIVLPVLVMLPYALAFDWSTGGYPPAKLLDDVWVANGVAEARQVLVTSYVDYVASLLPQYGIFSCLKLLKKLLRRQPQSFPPPPTSLAAIVPTPDPALASAILPDTKESRAVRLTSVGMAIWGAVVLAFHVRAQAISAVHFDGCVLQSRAWFVSKPACSIAYLNCHRRGVNGSAAELDEILSHLHRPALTRIAFTHCSALHMPDTITQFPALYSVQIYNCTLVDWPATAAVTQAAHPELMIVMFGSSDVRFVPPALLHDRLPKSFSWVGFYNCTIAELPEDIGDVWARSGISLLALERTRVRRLPPSLGRLQWEMMWLGGSLIEELPDKLLANSSIKILHLSGNPLTSVPSVVGGTSQLFELFVEDTNVTSLPGWAANWLKALPQTGNKVTVSFNGSPLCAPGGPFASERVCGLNFGTRYGVAPYEDTAIKFPL